VVTDSSMTGSVNGVPRHRMVVRFVDAHGDTRWVTKRATTWGALREGEAVTVHYDPAEPGDQRRMVVRSREFGEDRWWR
jgi:hypothetical protein